MTEQKILEIMQENKIYKNLEEQLGCPLEVVFKALKEGIYIETPFCKDEMINIEVVLNDDYRLAEIYYGELMDYFCLKDYKKTWWLKEDKTE